MRSKIKHLVLVAVVASVFGGGAGYLGANLEMGWVTSIGQPTGAKSVTTLPAKPSRYSRFMHHRGIDTSANQRSVFDRYEQLYRLELTFAPVTGATPGSFDQYLLDQPSDHKDVRQQNLHQQNGQIHTGIGRKSSTT